MTEDTIKVAIRVRPKIAREEAANLMTLWEVNGNEIYPTSDEVRSQERYTFDYVFNTDKTNSDVYEIVRPIVLETTAGINGTIFAYGQTSSGKTHSIMGNANDLGIIPLAIDDIFTAIERDTHRKFLVRTSYVEIYNEKIHDLLNKNNKDDLKIREAINGSVSVNATEMVTSTRQELKDVVRMGNKNRQVGETKMNERSSRSHVIFQIIIESSALNEDDDAPVKVSQLYIVDLAGSERATQTKATGTRLKEGGYINRSLQILSLVIRQLSEGAEHVKFRDSKLTRLLSNALGGNSKTLIISAITPVSAEDTLSTLQFAKSAKTISNKPKVNEILDDAAMIRKHQRQEKLLLKELEQQREKNITLERDQYAKEQRIKDLESKLVKIRKDFVCVKAPVKKQARRHTFACEARELTTIHEKEILILETPPDDFLFLENKIDSIDVSDEAAIEERFDMRQSLASCGTSTSDEIVPREQLMEQYDLLNKSHCELKEFAELQFLSKSEEIEELKAQLAKYEVTNSELEITNDMLKKRFKQREAELLACLVERTGRSDSGAASVEELKYTVNELEEECENLRNQLKLLPETSIQRSSSDSSIHYHPSVPSISDSLNESQSSGELLHGMLRDVSRLEKILSEEPTQIEVLRHENENYSMEQDKLQDEIKRLVDTVSVVQAKHEIDLTEAQNAFKLKEEEFMKLKIVVQENNINLAVMKELHDTELNELKMGLTEASAQRTEAIDKFENTLLKLQEVSAENVSLQAAIASDNSNHYVEEINVLKDTVAKLQQQVQKQSEDYLERVKKAETKLRSLESEASRFKDKEIENIRLQNAHQLEKLHESEITISNLQDEISKLTDEMFLLNEAYLKVQNELYDIEDKHLAAIEQLSVEEKTNQTLLNEVIQLKDCKEKVDALEIKCKIALNENTKLKNENIKLKDDVITFDELRVTLQNELNKLEYKHLEVLEDVCAVSKVLKNKELQLIEYKETLGTFESDFDVITADNIELKNVIIQLQAAESILKDKVNELEWELQIQVSKVTEDKLSLETVVSQLKDKVKALEAELQNDDRLLLETVVTELKKKVSGLDLELQNEVSIATKEKLLLETMVTELKEKVSSLEMELQNEVSMETETKEKMIALQNEFQLVVDENAKFNIENAKLQNEVVNLSEKYRSVKDDCTRLHSEINSITSKYESLQVEIGDKENIEVLQEKYRVTKTENANNVEKLRVTSKEAILLRSENKSLKRNNEELRREHQVLMEQVRTSASQFELLNQIILIDEAFESAEIRDFENIDDLKQEYKRLACLDYDLVIEKAIVNLLDTTKSLNPRLTEALNRTIRVNRIRKTSFDQLLLITSNIISDYELRLNNFAIKENSEQTLASNMSSTYNMKLNELEEKHRLEENQLTNEITTLKTKLSESDVTEVTTLRETLVHKDDLLAKQSLEIMKLKQVMEFKTKIGLFENDRIKLENNITTLNFEIKNLEDKLRFQELEFQRKFKKLVKETTEENKHEIASLQRLNKEQNEEIDTLLREASVLKRQLDDALRRTVALEKQNTDLQEENKFLDDEVLGAIKEIEDLRKEILALKKKPLQSTDSVVQHVSTSSHTTEISEDWIHCDLTGTIDMIEELKTVVKAIECSLLIGSGCEDCMELRKTAEAIEVNFRSFKTEIKQRSCQHEDLLVLLSTVSTDNIDTSENVSEKLDQLKAVVKLKVEFVRLMDDVLKRSSKRGTGTSQGCQSCGIRTLGQEYFSLVSKRTRKTVEKVGMIDAKLSIEKKRRGEFVEEYKVEVNELSELHRRILAEMVDSAVPKKRLDDVICKYTMLKTVCELRNLKINGFAKVLSSAGYRIGNLKGYGTKVYKPNEDGTETVYHISALGKEGESDAAAGGSGCGDDPFELVGLDEPAVSPPARRRSLNGHDLATAKSHRQRGVVPKKMEMWYETKQEREERRNDEQT